ncbi:hypothetical protein MOTE_20510 [Moorella thermoacetica]|uniref:Uncharacterized protein n=1 Tax=Neomoorella thermoacetica TaxID=1525 RepID=A0A1J5NYE5_NEOTH|nr:hypothetical protein MOTE_20510 [Moorella thermoacetica]
MANVIHRSSSLGNFLSFRSYTCDPEDFRAGSRVEGMQVL